MSRIHVLDPVVVDRIAAGEVVERPASVVKELVDNALDAGAQRVTVRIAAGGRAEISVVDDGSGMDTADAALAFTQHATSKIRELADLEAISTLGFRGEALASIAAVSRVELITGTGEGAGTRVCAQAGTQTIDAHPSPAGTSVVVRDLFYNTPARGKHLRTDATEAGRVLAAVEDFALLRTDVHFRVIRDGKVRLSAPPVSSLAERFRQIFGAQAADAWIDVDSDGSYCRVHGGVAQPHETRASRAFVRLFVNGRAISDGRLSHAVIAAYDRLLPRGRFPLAALFVEADPSDVDVNVHPRKAEVRFSDPGRAYGALRGAVARALAATMTAPDLGRSGALQTDLRSTPARGRHAEPPETAMPDGVVREGFAEGSPQGLPLGDWHAVGTSAPIAPLAGAVRPLAQYANTYIVAADERGLLIVDQHVAHERILFEQVLRQRAGGRLPVQRLLVPETVELTPSESAAAQEYAELLDAYGFEVEPFGGDTWALRSVPEVIGTRRACDVFRSLLESLSERGTADAVEKLDHDTAASIACHAAVRANQPLSLEAMARLLADLWRCDAPARCPHGRPVWVRLEHERLERELWRH